MNKKQNSIFLIIFTGVIILIGIALLVESVRMQTKYDRVEAIFTIEGNMDHKKVYADYYYNNVHYARKSVNFYSSSMGGGMHTIYINPEKPDKPHVPYYSMAIIMIVFSVGQVILVKKIEAIGVRMSQ